MPLYDFECTRCPTRKELVVPRGITGVTCECGGVLKKTLLCLPSPHKTEGYSAKNGYSHCK